jgi:tetratricopeptide (TPR) repeat protein
MIQTNLKMMKKLIISILLLTTFFGYTQKNELKQAQKLINKEFFSEALDVLSNNKDLILASDVKYQAQYYYLNGWALKEDSQSFKAVFSLRKSIELERSIRQKKYIENANFLIQNAELELVNSAAQDNKNDKYLEASKKLYDAYLMNPEKEDNITYLYYAASSAGKSKEYDTALEYYLKLKNMGYTGAVSEYFVTSVESGIEEKVSETEYNLFKTSKYYTNQRIGKSESRFLEIVENVVLIYVQKGDNDNAIAAIKDAREINPEDFNLFSEADLYMKLGDMDKLKVLMNEAITKDPGNAIIYYNLGVVNAEEGEFEYAMNYYNKALELDHDYAAAYFFRGTLSYRLSDYNNACKDARKAQSLGYDASQLIQAVCK